MNTFTSILKLPAYCWKCLKFDEVCSSGDNFCCQVYPKGIPQKIQSGKYICPEMDIPVAEGGDAAAAQ